MSGCYKKIGTTETTTTTIYTGGPHRGERETKTVRTTATCGCNRVRGCIVWVCKKYGHKAHYHDG